MNDRVVLDSTGESTERVPLSVGGVLSIQARTIEQRTRLMAPFGQLALRATDRLTLADGSVTSVSAQDTLLPFGRIQLGTEWVYDLGASTLESPELPTPAVDLSAR